MKPIDSAKSEGLDSMRLDSNFRLSSANPNLTQQEIQKPKTASSRVRTFQVNTDLFQGQNWEKKEINIEDNEKFWSPVELHDRQKELEEVSPIMNRRPSSKPKNVGKIIVFSEFDPIKSRNQALKTSTESFMPMPHKKNIDSQGSSYSNSPVK